MYSRILSLAFIFVLYSCVEPYTPPSLPGEKGALVVDAFLDTGSGHCMVTLLRSKDITSSEKPVLEPGATVTIEEENGGTSTLNEVSAGKFEATILANKTGRYRLHIATQDRREYVSSFAESKDTPPIDSVTWTNDDKAIQIMVNTHDPEKKSQRYLWRYVETWEYTAPFPSTVEYDFVDSIGKLRELDVYRCYRSASSSKIIIGNTRTLSEDRVSNFEVTSLPRFSKKYQLRYSIIVYQRVLTEESYYFWELLKKNSESLGTLFDPQPAHQVSNVVNVNEPGEIILGYFDVGDVESKRMFIAGNEMPRGFTYFDTEGCTSDFIGLFKGKIRAFHELSSIYELTKPLYAGGGILVGYEFTQRRCMDCRMAGGTLTRPDFW